MTGIEWMLLLIGAIFMIGSFFITERLSPSELNKIAELSEGELKKIIESGRVNAKGRIEEEIDNQLDASMDIVERALEKETNSKIMAISEYSDTVIEGMNKTHNEIMFLYSMLNDKHAELTGMVSDLQRLVSDIKRFEAGIESPAKEAAAENKMVPAVNPVSAAAPSASQPTAAKAVQNPAAASQGKATAARVTSANTAQGGTAAAANAAAAQAVSPANAAPQKVTAQADAAQGRVAAAADTVPARETVRENAQMEQLLWDGQEEVNERLSAQQQILALHKKGLTEVEIAKKLNMGIGEVRLVIGLYRGE